MGNIGRILRINFLAARRITDSLAPGVVDGGAIVHLSPGAGMKGIMRLDQLRPILAADDGAVLRHSGALAQSPVDGGLAAAFNTGVVDYAPRR